MMLTDLPPRFIHRVRDAAAYVHDLAQLGLELLCPCGDDHSGRLRVLEGDGAGTALPPVCTCGQCGPDCATCPLCAPGGPGPLDVHLACGCGWHQSVPTELDWWATLVLEQHAAQCRLERAA